MAILWEDSEKKEYDNGQWQLILVMCIDIDIDVIIWYIY